MPPPLPLPSQRLGTHAPPTLRVPAGTPSPPDEFADAIAAPASSVGAASPLPPSTASVGRQSLMESCGSPNGTDGGGGGGGGGGGDGVDARVLAARAKRDRLLAATAGLPR